MRTLTLLTFLSLATFSRAATPAVLPAAVANSSAAQVGFEENKGQVRTTDGDAAPFVRYRLSQGNTQLFLLENGIAYQFSRMHYPDGYAELAADARQDMKKQKQLDAMREQVRLETYRMDMMLDGADANARITTEGRSSDYTHYYNHDALDVHTYSKVTYHEIYPGIDWVVYTTEKGMKYDFVVRPGADPNQIRMRFKDHEELSVDDEGNLIHGNRMGRFTEERPVSFQDGKEVQTRFLLEGNMLRFALENYDRSRTLTIDPARIWGTYYGGSSLDQALDCAVDGSGNVYLAGYAYSADAIASGGHQNSSAGSSDAFLAKFDPSGIRLWGTYYGGQETEFGVDCWVDGSNNVYLSGETKSSAGIATADAHQTAHAGTENFDVFLVKFDATGTRLWGTYYGGSETDTDAHCAVDATGNVYVSGTTSSSSGIASGGHQNVFGGIGNLVHDAFLVKFSPTGTRLWATYYGGPQTESFTDCAVDANGAVYLSGTTNSSTAIASGGHQNTLVGVGYGDAFLVKFNASGVREWGTYYGGTDFDGAVSCAVDGVGNVYMAGTTQSDSGIASGGHQNTRSGGEDAYLVKFNTSGVRLWATYYGGGSAESGRDCATDGNNNVYLTGTTASPTGISSNGFQDTYAGGWDGYLVKFNSDGTRKWGTYYGSGGAFDDQGNACATDGENNVYMAGWTGSSTVIASGGHQNTFAGGTWDAFLVKFEGDEPVVLGCATALVAETEPNNGVSTSNPITDGTPISGDMGVCVTTDNTSDYFGFTTTGQGVLKVLACLSNSGPTALNVTFRVLNPGGSTLGTFALPAGANNAVLTGEFLLPCRGITSYRIAVDNPSTTVCTHYAFSYTILPPVFGNDPEPNDAIGASATPVAYNTDRDGRNNFDLESTYDYYSISLPTNGVLNIETQAEHAGAVPSTMAVALLNSVGTVQQTWSVAVGANGTPVSSAVSITCRSTISAYYIRINSAVCGTSYRFKYTVTPPLFAADTEPNNSQPGTPLTHDTYTEGHLAFDAESTYDIYRIVPSSDGKVNIEVQAEHTGATPGTIQLVFLNAAGTPLQTWNVPIGTNGVATTTVVSLPCQSGGTNYDLRLSTATCGTSYKMKYTLTPAVFAIDAEPNNSSGQAVVAADSINNDGHLAFNESSADYFRLQAATDGVLNVTVSAEYAIASTTDSIQVRLRDYITNVLVTWKVGIGANGIPNTQILKRTCAGTEQVYYLEFLNPSVCGVSYRFSYTVTPPAFADDLEPNASSSQAIVANANTNYDGRVEFNYDNNTDYFRLQAPTDGVMSVTIHAESASASAGTMTLYLRDAPTNIIETWTVNVGANGVPISNTFVHRCTGTEQVYYLEADDPNVCGVSYRFSYSVTPPAFADDLEPNQSSTQAINATSGVDYDGRVSFNYDNNFDYFRLLAPNDGVLNVTIQAENAGPGAGTMTLYLRDAITNIIETWTVNVGANGTSVPQTFSHTCTGTQLVYFLEPFNPTVCGVSYRFSYSVTPPVFAGDAEPNNTTAAAVVAADSTNYDGRLAFNESSVDYFRLQAATDGVLNVTVSAEHGIASTTDSIQVRLRDNITNVLVTWKVGIGANGIPNTQILKRTCAGTEQVYYLEFLNPSVCGVSYRFSYTVTPPAFADDLEPNASSGQATVANANTNYDGRVEFNYDNNTDYFRLQAPTDGVMSVTIQAENASPSTGTMTLYLRDQITNVIETWTVNVGANGAPVSNTFVHRCTGTEQVYYLEADDPNVCGVSYRFSYSVTPPAFADDLEPNQSSTQATNATAGLDYNGRVDFNYDNDFDYFRLQAPTDGVLNVTIQAENASASAGTMTLYLRDAPTNIIETWTVNVGANGVPVSNTFMHRCTGTEQVYYMEADDPNVCGVSYRFSYTVTPPAFADDLEPNQTSTQAISATAGTNYDGRIDFNYDNNFDYFRLQAATDGVLNVTIQAESASASAGTMTLYLRDAPTNIIETWTVNIGANGTSVPQTFSHTCTGTEQVFFLEAYNPSICGVSYRFIYTVTPPLFTDDPEPNQTSTQAISAMAGTNYEGRIDFNYDNDFDYFRLQAPTDGVLNVTMEAEHGGPAGGTMTLYLRDAPTNIIETWTVNIGANGVPDIQTFSHRCTGTEQVYYLEVDDPNVCGVSYRFSYTVTPPVFADDLEPNQTSTQAISATAGTNYDGRVEFNYDNNFDYFRLQAPTDGVLNVTIQAENAGPGTGTMTLYLRDQPTNVIETWTVNIGANGVPVSNTFSHLCTGTEQVYYLEPDDPNVCGVSYRFSYTVTPPAFADDLEPNQTSTQAISIDLNATPADGRVEFEYDNNFDYFRINHAGGPIVLHTRAEAAGTAGTMQILIRDAITNVLQTAIIPVGGNSVPVANTYTSPSYAAGVYYIEPFNPTSCGTSYRFDCYDDDGDGTCNAFDLCAGGPEPGAPCNDNNGATINDVVLGNCICQGTLLGADCNGVPGGPALPGTACSDNNVCTVNDVFDANCLCAGTFADADGDGTCDASDLCPGGPEPGTACNDNNGTTINDMIQANCLCAGTLPGNDCEGVPGGPAVPGSACDDNNVCTTGDVYGVNCLCAGTFADADGDGTCNANDVCPGGPEPGTPCNDNSACTTNDVIQANCTCAGTPVDPNDNNVCTLDGCDAINGVTNIFQDADVDGTCDANDLCPGGPEPGTPCNDNNVCTTNDVIGTNCQCAGTFADTDADGTCDANDLCPGGPEPGTACNDNNSATINDIIQENCLCAGTLLGNDCNGVPGGPAVPGTSCNDNNVCTTGDVFDANCLCVGTFADADEDGTCDADDVCLAGPEPGTPCNDGNGNTINDVIGTNCLCSGVNQACSNTLTIEFQLDANPGQVTWEIREQGTNDLVQNGGGLVAANSIQTVSTCVPNGCYYLKVMDSVGNGMGGYILRTFPGNVRIIDNRNNFTSGGVSQIAGNEGFCLPLGPNLTQAIYTSCDKLDWVTGEYFVVHPNANVSAGWTAGTGANEAKYGYETWIYNPNGGYSFRRYRSHDVSDGFGPDDPDRACHMKINNWAAANQIPTNVLMNVRIRTRINNVNSNWGPACRFMINPAQAACPLTKLMDIPGNANLSCGASRKWGNGNYVYARPVSGATQYQFRFRIDAEGFLSVRTVPTYYLQLNWPTFPLQNSKTYDVEVRAYKSGAWCVNNTNPTGGAPFVPWGDVCLLTINNNPADGGNENALGEGESERSEGLRMYPNPNRGDQLYLSLDAIEEGVGTVSVDILDLYGKRVSARTIAVQDGFVNTVLDLEGDMANGMYLVNITAGGQRYTERLVIQR